MARGLARWVVTGGIFAVVAVGMVQVRVRDRLADDRARRRKERRPGVDEGRIRASRAAAPRVGDREGPVWGPAGCQSDMRWHVLSSPRNLTFLAIAKSSTRHTYKLLATASGGTTNVGFYHLRPRASSDGGAVTVPACGDARCGARGANATLVDAWAAPRLSLIHI